jgi:hypothetical protein
MGRASGSLLALIGGPYGASVLALGAAYYYLSTRENTAADAASQYADVIGAANTAKEHRLLAKSATKPKPQSPPRFANPKPTRLPRSPPSSVPPQNSHSRKPVLSG